MMKIFSLIVDENRMHEHLHAASYFVSCSSEGVHGFLTDMLARYQEEELKLQPLGHMCSQRLPL